MLDLKLLGVKRVHWIKRKLNINNINMRIKDHKLDISNDHNLVIYHKRITKKDQELLVEHTSQPPLPVEPTNQPPETTDAPTAHTRTPNAVVVNVVIATAQLEFANARTDGPEVLALPVTEDLETSPMEARLSNAQCAHTREPNAVVVTVEIATDKPENADARTDGPEVLAPTREESLALDTLATTLTLIIPTLSTVPLPTPWDLSGLLLSEYSPPSALFSSLS